MDLIKYFWNWFLHFIDNFKDGLQFGFSLLVPGDGLDLARILGLAVPDVQAAGITVPLDVVLVGLVDGLVVEVPADLRLRYSENARWEFGIHRRQLKICG